MTEELAPGLQRRLPLSQTPTGGYHVPYRCAEIRGNQKLAQHLTADGRPGTMIETRGEGGYIIIPPFPPACHPLKRPYVLCRGDLGAIPIVTPDERAILLNAARTFNTYVPPTRIVSGYARSNQQPSRGDRPGDLFNVHAVWSDILEPHDWTHVGQRGELVLWKRPGKGGRGVSATTNYAGREFLYCFTTNGYPFEAETAYTKFAAYALLEHSGDFHNAARLLALKGYRTARQGEVLPPLHDPWLGPRWRAHGIPLAVRRIAEEGPHG
jgi:hypothetical protein